MGSVRFTIRNPGRGGERGPDTRPGMNKRGVGQAGRPEKQARRGSKLLGVGAGVIRHESDPKKPWRDLPLGHTRTCDMYKKLAKIGEGTYGQVRRVCAVESRDPVRCAPRLRTVSYSSVRLTGGSARVQIRVGDFDQVGEYVFGMHDATLPKRIAAAGRALFGIVKYLAGLPSMKFLEALIGSVELVEAAVKARVDPDVGMSGSNKDALGIERDGATARHVGPEIIAGITDGLCKITFAPSHMPCA